MDALKDAGLKLDQFMESLPDAETAEDIQSHSKLLDLQALLAMALAEREHRDVIAAAEAERDLAVANANKELLEAQMQAQAAELAAMRSELERSQEELQLALSAPAEARAHYVDRIRGLNKERLAVAGDLAAVDAMLVSAPSGERAELEHAANTARKQALGHVLVALDKELDRLTVAEALLAARST